MSVQLVSTVTDEEYTVYILTTIDPNLRYVIGRDGHLDQSQTWDMDSTDLRISAGWFPFEQGNGRVWLCCVSLLGYDFTDSVYYCSCTLWEKSEHAGRKPCPKENHLSLYSNVSMPTKHNHCFSHFSKHSIHLCQWLFIYVFFQTLLATSWTDWLMIKSVILLQCNILHQKI